MRRIVLFCALGLLGGCRTAEPLTNEVITLFCSTSEPSKTAALSAGDAVGVFAALEGAEDYFVENVKWVVGSDGHTLTTSPAAYYPEVKQAVRFYTYLPYHTGDFSVPTDQSTAAALKQADLCWATASSTPVATPVSLEFEHVLSRLVVTTKESVSQLLASHAFTGGILDIKTGTFTPTTSAHLTTTGNELILPAQSLPHLVLTVSGIDYTFEAPLTLPAEQITTLHLTLNPSTKTATLAGSSVTPWLATTATGNPTQAASNTLTIHWPKCHPQSAAVNKVVLRIKDPTTNTTADYTVSSGITYADQTFTVPLSSSQLQYPYIIQSIHLYNSNTWIHGSSNVLGAVIERAGSCVFGINQPLNTPTASDYVTIGGLKWARSNLVAINTHECRVGKHAYDGGVYFQFGSLIGWKGGDQQVTIGTGEWYPQPPLATSTTPLYWSGSFSWAGESMVWPREFTRGNNITSFPSNTTNLYYFGDTTIPGNYNINIYPGLSEGRLSVDAVGDPCTYYLGSPWRLPRIIEFVNLNAGVNPSALYENASWSAWGDIVSVPGVFMGPDAKTHGAQSIFIPRVGVRQEQGALYQIYLYALALSSDTYSAVGMFYTVSDANVVRTAWGNPRVLGLPARCVSN